MSRHKDPIEEKLSKFIQTLPPEFNYYVSTYKTPGRYYGFRTLNGAKAFRDGELKGSGDVFFANTRTQVA